MAKQNQTRKKREHPKKGGKTFATSKNVSLSYNNAPVVCDLCKTNNFRETIGALEKSKVRSGIGQAFFGDVAEILDTTSVIIYTCKTCGLCKIIRNQDPIKIVATEV
jgi:hypothetical protein